MNKEQPADLPPFHPALRVSAKIISYLFHPLFVPVYMGWFFLYVLHLFPDVEPARQPIILIQFFVSYTLLPLVTVLIGKGLGFLKTVQLKESKDRIIPYMATMIFYFWMWYVSKNLAYFPKASVMFSLAVFLTTCFGAFVNSFLKVSMHALSIGVVVTLIILMALNTTLNFGPYLSVALLIGGLVCTARLLNNDHHAIEVYAGLLLGMLAQLIAYFFVR